jgi:hypothetical protein
MTVTANEPLKLAELRRKIRITAAIAELVKRCSRRDEEICEDLRENFYIAEVYTSGNDDEN